MKEYRVNTVGKSVIDESGNTLAGPFIADPHPHRKVTEKADLADLEAAAIASQAAAHQEAEKEALRIQKSLPEGIMLFLRTDGFFTCECGSAVRAINTGCKKCHDFPACSCDHKKPLNTICPRCMKWDCGCGRQGQKCICDNCKAEYRYILVLNPLTQSKDDSYYVRVQN